LISVIFITIIIIVLAFIQIWLLFNKDNNRVPICNYELISYQQSMQTLILGG
jgi:hypothetical protein